MRTSRKPLRVLFLCTGNSARSQIAEMLLNRKGRGRFVAESAGSHPAERVNPHAIEALERHGYYWTARQPRGMDGLTDQQWDFVVTVCDRAKESCPLFPGEAVMAHWGMADPAAVEGSEDTIRRAFDDTVLLINRRLDLFLALPTEKLTRLSLEQQVKDIGRTNLKRP
jgi:arsenate reductase (thioredoxin)